MHTPLTPDLTDDELHQRLSLAAERASKMVVMLAEQKWMPDADTIMALIWLLASITRDRPESMRVAVATTLLPLIGLEFAIEHAPHYDPSVTKLDGDAVTMLVHQIKQGRVGES